MGVMRTELTDPLQPPGLHNGVLVAMSHGSMAPGASVAPVWKDRKNERGRGKIMTLRRRSTCIPGKVPWKPRPSWDPGLGLSISQIETSLSPPPPPHPHPLCCLKSKPVDLNLDECESWIFFSLIRPIFERSDQNQEQTDKKDSCNQQWWDSGQWYQPHSGLTNTPVLFCPV